MKSNYPEHVSLEDRPEKNIEDIPDDVLERALRSIRWKACPHCGAEQWIHHLAGHNTSHECVECGETLKVVG